MSRAFVDETDGNLSEDDIPKLVIPLPEGVKNYVTPEGAAMLQEEMETLQRTVRPGLTSAVSKDVRDGDAADSEAVLAARRKLRTVDRRIEYLREMIERMEIIDPAGQAPDRVRFGAAVTVTEKDRKKKYRIVGVDESDPKKGDISWLSPMARALLSHAAGDRVKVSLPRGDAFFRIEKITYG